MTALFITAAGTDVGKTFVAAGLIRLLRQRGGEIDAIKPVVSGFNSARAGDSDCGVLLRALGLPLSEEEIEDISPWRFAAPLSPDMAARHEGKEIDFEQLVSFCETAIEEAEGHMLVEGVGGVMVPLDQTNTVLDWIATTRNPSSSSSFDAATASPAAPIITGTTGLSANGRLTARVNARAFCNGKAA